MNSCDRQKFTFLKAKKKKSHSNIKLVRKQDQFIFLQCVRSKAKLLKCIHSIEKLITLTVETRYMLSQQTF